MPCTSIVYDVIPEIIIVFFFLSQRRLDIHNNVSLSYWLPRARTPRFTLHSFRFHLWCAYEFSKIINGNFDLFILCAQQKAKQETVTFVSQILLLLHEKWLHLKKHKQTYAMWFSSFFNIFIGHFILQQRHAFSHSNVLPHSGIVFFFFFFFTMVAGGVRFIWQKDEIT